MAISDWFNLVLPFMAAGRISAALGRPLGVYGKGMALQMQDTRTPRALRRHVFTGDEVFVATYLKSGTNWAMQIGVQTAYRGAAEFEHIHHLVPWPEAPPIEPRIPLARASAERRSPTGRLVIKTHLPAIAVPYDPRAAYVTVIRDPKEVAVSAYHFILGVFGIVDLVSFDEWYTRMVHDGPLLAGWVQHTASYWAWRERANVLVLTYPEMKADLDGSVRRIAELMGVELSEAEHAKVVERSSFAYMKADNEKFSALRPPLRRDQPLPAMVRRGTTGGSSELLSRERQLAIDAWCRARLDERGSDFPYTELFATGRRTGP